MNLCDSRCRKCIYHIRFGADLIACDYLGVEGVPRPKVEPCIVYVKGTAGQRRNMIREKKRTLPPPPKEKRKLGRPRKYSVDEAREKYLQYQAEYRAKKRAERLNKQETLGN